MEKALQGDEDARVKLRQEFHERRVRERKERKAKNYVSTLASFVCFFAFWCAGAGIFALTEGWSYYISFYFWCAS